MSLWVRCTAKARSLCEDRDYCEEGELVLEDSECGKFILKIAMEEDDEYE